MDDFPRFVGERRQVEKIDFMPRQRFDGRPRGLREAPRLRNFAGTRVLAARGAVDQQDARRRRFILLAGLGGGDVRARLQPLDRKFARRLCEARSRGRNARRLSILDVAVPRRRENFLEFRGHRFEGGIVEAGEKALAKRVFRQRDIEVLPPNRWFRHAAPPIAWPRNRSHATVALLCGCALRASPFAGSLLWQSPLPNLSGPQSVPVTCPSASSSRPARMAFHVLAKHAIHSRLPAFARGLEVRDDLGTVAN